MEILYTTKILNGVSPAAQYNSCYFYYNHELTRKNLFGFNVILEAEQQKMF